MTHRDSNCQPNRRGAIAVLAALLIVPMLAMVAFAVDIGYLLKVRTDLQRAVDAAALAAVQDLVPAADGTQDLTTVRASVREYLTMNLGPSFVVLDSDIEIGRFDPATIYSNVTLLDTGVFDAVRITVRRDDRANSPVSLFFARVIGNDSASVIAMATAVLQKGSSLPPGSDILPFAVPQEEWDSADRYATWSIYADGKLLDSDDNEVPGNWGTIDIGAENNATSDLIDQIDNGLRQSDLDDLSEDGRIPSADRIESTEPLWANGDPGLSVGIKDAVRDAHTFTRIVPIYDTLSGDPAGGNLQYHIVKWGMVRVLDSRWTGAKKSYVLIEKSCGYDGSLRPHPDLGNTTDVIEGAFTSPALVQ
jgi:hypothetical protein